MREFLEPTISKIILFVVLFLILPSIYIGRIVDDYSPQYQILPFGGGIFHIIGLSELYRPNYDLALHNILFLIISLTIFYLVACAIFGLKEFLRPTLPKIILFIGLFLILPSIYPESNIGGSEVRYQILYFGGFLHILRLYNDIPNYHWFFILYKAWFLLMNSIFSYLISCKIIGYCYKIKHNAL